ncbi:hypothetical protein CMI37_25730 [Candidatus Pacearchaeota archaeon]|nr:hypothetical protein [Candidatus Pacearchaeota archaeon]
MVILRIKPDQEKLKAFMLDQGVTLQDVLDAVLDLKNLNGDQLNELAADLKNYIANWKGA